MPWTDNDPPSVAKNWTAAEKHRCVSAANAVLERGGDDQEAIFACIHAAGKTKHKVLSPENQRKNDAYERLRHDTQEVLEGLGALYAAGDIGLGELRDRIRAEVRSYHIAIAILATDGEFDEGDPDDLSRLDEELDGVYGQVDDLIDTLDEGDYSDQYVIWRAGLFGFARLPFVRWMVPDDILQLVPFTPGDDCLGGAACGCMLEVVYGDESVSVELVLGPTEHCSLCLAAAIESPWVFTYEELAAEGELE